MKNQYEIVLSRVHGPKGKAWFNIENGRLRPMVEGNPENSCGNFYDDGKNRFALYAEDGVLYFQWNEHRWNMASPKLELNYRHSFHEKMTLFSTNSLTVEYPAWWKDDPTFDPNLPELDENEDFLAYAVAVKNNLTLQDRLIDAWSKA